jgi:hypothetical protein
MPSLRLLIYSLKQVVEYEQFHYCNRPQKQIGYPAKYVAYPFAFKKQVTTQESVVMKQIKNNQHMWPIIKQLEDKIRMMTLTQQQLKFEISKAMTRLNNQQEQIHLLQRSID